MNFVGAVRFGASIIDLWAASIVIVGIGRAVRALLRRHGIFTARLAVADGVVGALSFAVAAALLRVVALQSWLDIATFATTFAIRTLVKRVFIWESDALRGSGATLLDKPG